MGKKFILEREMRGPEGMERSYLATDAEGRVYFTRSAEEADRFDTRAEAVRHPYMFYSIGPGTLRVQETQT